MPESAPEFAEILRRLNENNVRCVLIAVVACGSAHVTQDVDVVAESIAPCRTLHENAADDARFFCFPP